jgi:hypothetical protein
MNKPSLLPFHLSLSKSGDKLPIDHTSILDPQAELTIDFSEDSLPERFRGIYSKGKWTAYLIFHDPDNEEFNENTEIFTLELSKGERQRTVPIAQPSFSVYISPIGETRLATALARGTLARQNQDRRMLAKIQETLEVIRNAPTEHKSDLLKNFLIELGVESPGAVDLAAPDIFIAKLLGGLKEFNLLNFARSEISKALVSKIAQIFQGLPLIHLNAALEVFKLIDSLIPKITYDFYEANLTRLIDGPEDLFALKIRDQDLEAIRFESNTEGPKQSDLRHIISWHFIPTKKIPQRLKLVQGQSQIGLAYVEEFINFHQDLSIKVAANELIIGPCADLLVHPLKGTWSLRKDNGTPASEVRIETTEDGRLILKGFEQLWIALEKSKAQFRLRVEFCFQKAETEAFELHA